MKNDVYHLSFSTTEAKITSVKDGKTLERSDILAVEEPLEIRLTYGKDMNRETTSVSITMRTPGQDTLLATGFLFTEGIINKMDDIEDVLQPIEDCKRRSANVITISIKENVIIDISKLQRHFYTTSSCGVCGKASIEAIYTYTGRAEGKAFQVSSSLLYSLPQRLSEAQQVFQSTGGLHASALFDLQGNLLLLQEDVGRHNALDKLIGQALLEGIERSETILLLSGRASFELIQKAAMAGISFVAAIGAPSSLAMQLAESSGITLIGFLSDKRFNIYSSAHRIAG